MVLLSNTAFVQLSKPLLYLLQGPVSYQFEYKVEDEEAAVDFGHEEAHEGDVAMGKYFVLLPDGRKQTVEYTADTEGFKPMITYEDTQNGGYANDGYPRGGNGNGNGNGYSYNGNGNGNGNGHGHGNGNGHNGNGNGNGYHATNGGYNY